MVCDRLTCNFAIAGARMNARMTNLVPGPFRGMLFRAALIFVVVMRDAEHKRVLQILLRLDVCIPFFFPRKSLICVGMCK